MSKKVLSQIVVLVGLLGFAAFALPNATKINDWLHSLSYSPPKLIEQIANDAGMSETGKRLFYRYEPKLLSEAEIEDQCGFGEIVLGCFTNDGIFIVDFNSVDEYKRTLVTAAHEMLHVAYYRQDDQQNKAMRPLLDKRVSSASTDIKQEINSYNDTVQRYDEAFAIIGSQLNDLDPKLEDIYTEYFSDRTKVIQAFEASPEAD
ncbi:TPA: hypothetical protein EYO12_00955 [Candidatus Saccharibacteria bacterium]|nr:hypothetical protein [Candidatus Saccharibacteria bacterium]HIO87287.1 hypothetical protein [Candidatus Saccharibacteria bacterium]